VVSQRSFTRSALESYGAAEIMVEMGLDRWLGFGPDDVSSTAVREDRRLLVRRTSLTLGARRLSELTTADLLGAQLLPRMLNRPQSSRTARAHFHCSTSEVSSFRDRRATRLRNTGHDVFLRKPADGSTRRCRSFRDQIYSPCLDKATPTRTMMRILSDRFPAIAEACNQGGPLHYIQITLVA
jgi:hypothetical protein